MHDSNCSCCHSESTLLFVSSLSDCGSFNPHNNASQLPQRERYEKPPMMWPPEAQGKRLVVVC